MKYLGVLIKGASGSLGGLTASHNKYGDYFRGRTTPVNPNSTRQQLVRSIFAGLSNAWSVDLTQTQRNGWNLYGQEVSVIDALGQMIHLTGYCHYLRSNSIALLAGVDRIDEPPTTFILGEPDETMAGTISEATQKVSVAFDDTRAWCSEDNAVMQISMSRPASPGVIWIPKINRVAGYIKGASAEPAQSPVEIAVPFAVVEGQKVTITGRILRADGRLSGPFRDGATVAS